MSGGSGVVIVVARFPKATLAVLFITAGLTALQFRTPVLIGALERKPDMLASGQWWRLITPILINPEGWQQIAVNLAGIAIVGILVERIFGSAGWLMLYLTGAVVGELAGWRWQPTGAGSSVAVCGLLGGLALWLVWRKRPIQLRFGGAVIVMGAVVLIAGHDIHGPSLVAGGLGAAALTISRDATRAGA